jgi:hypothetical protein
MPLIKFLPQKPAFAPTQKLRAARNVPASPAPILVPIGPPPSTGAFSNAFSNAFNV